jgi:G3E family GTPase
VIVNEFGEIGLDHLLVAPGTDDVVLLNAGCLCCTISNTLADTLADLFHRRVRGEVPSFKRVVIETTGLAQPAPILRLLMIDRGITTHFALDALVTTVDAVHGEMQLDLHPQALQQAAMADRLVVTKTDLTGGTVPTGLAARLRRLNPGAPILVAVQGAISAHELLGIGAHARVLDLPRWLGLPGNAPHGHDLHGDGRIRSRSLRFDRPLRWADYAAFLEALRHLPAESLLRTKGLLAIEGDLRPYVIQGVQHSFSSPLRLPTWPTDDRRGYLVLITSDLDPALLDQALAPLLHPAEIG